MTWANVRLQAILEELPLEFFPGVYRDRIIAAVRAHVPDIQVEEVASAAMRGSGR